jgi:hypothetical protein
MKSSLCNLTPNSVTPNSVQPNTEEFKETTDPSFITPVGKVLKFRECDKVELVLSNTHIEKACSFLCLDTKNSKKCCNAKFCRDTFSRTECGRVIQQLREEIWTEGPLKSPGTVTSRKTKLISILKTQIVVDENNTKQLYFRMNGKEVCKSFYKTALAVPNKMFNSSIAYVLDRESNAGSEAFGPQPTRRTMTKSNTDAMVLSFLDTFFHSQGKRKLVDTSPGATGYLKESYTIRMKWIQLYDLHYLPSMKKCDDMAPVDYTRFCELRAKHRPYYIRHRKVSNKKWNHMECQDCVLLEEKVRRNLKDPELKVGNFFSYSII